MHNTITDQDGKRQNIMILPDKECVVNSGLSSTRGGKMASSCTRTTASAASGCRTRASSRGDQWVETNWDNALAVYAGVTKQILDTDGPSSIAFNASTTAVPAAASRTPGAAAS